MIIITFYVGHIYDIVIYVMHVISRYTNNMEAYVQSYILVYLHFSALHNLKDNGNDNDNEK